MLPVGLANEPPQPTSGANMPRHSKDRERRSRLSGRALGGKKSRAAMRTSNRLVIAVLAVLVGGASTIPAYADLIDKEPSAMSNWAWAILGGLAAIPAWWWRWWAGLPVTLFILFGLYAVHLEIQDPFVGPAIRAEFGQSYATQFYLAAVIWLLLNGIGVYVAIIRRRRQRRLTT